MKDYFSDRKRYADLWNGCMFEGEELIHPEQLQETDTVVYSRSRKGKVEQTSDVVMKQVSGNWCFALWILENQKKIDYSMPVRVMLKEALEYNRQIRNRKRKNADGYLKSKNTQAGTGKQPYYRNAGEFLYRFRAQDKLYPVITLVVYWGEEEWDGPRTLHEMLEFDAGCMQQKAGWEQQPEYGKNFPGRSEAGSEHNKCKDSGEELGRWLRKLIPDYPLHIVNLAEIEDYSCFRTELRLLFELYRCRNSKEEFLQYIESHEECCHMDEETCHMLGVITHFKQLQMLEGSENEEGIDMCQAIMDLINDGKMEGWSLGRAEGLTLGNADGENRMIQLTKKLLEQNKMAELTKALEDVEFRSRLFEEYHLISSPVV